MTITQKLIVGGAANGRRIACEEQWVQLPVLSSPMSVVDTPLGTQIQFDVERYELRSITMDLPGATTVLQIYVLQGLAFTFDDIYNAIVATEKRRMEEAITSLEKIDKELPRVLLGESSNLATRYLQQVSVLLGLGRVIEVLKGQRDGELVQ